MASRDEIVEMLDKAVELHNSGCRYSTDPDTGEDIDYMGELEFYTPKYIDGEYRGLGREIQLDWSAIGLGPALV